MKRILIIFILAVLTPAIAISQGVIDAYRLSSHKINGTARAAAMGNAFGALGGDFTSLSINPAGIAVYRSNEFVFTPTYNFNESKAMLGNSLFSDDNSQLKLNNIGFVGTYTSNNKQSGIVSFNFGIGYNNVLNYDHDFSADYNSSSASFLDGIVGYANSEGLLNGYLNRDIRDVWFVDWPAKLAWETFLMDAVTDEQNNIIDGQYVSLLYENELVDQKKVIDQRGGIHEFVLSGGLNIDHKLYLGATFGIQDVNIKQLTAYTEYLEGNNSFTYYDDLYIDGEGYNLKLGLIFRPVNALRLGIAYHTPTYYFLKEENTLAMQARLQEDYYDEGTNLYDYDFRSPAKLILSGALVLNKQAIISVDAEYQDYSNMKFKNGGVDGEDDFNDINPDINGAYESVVNLKLGGEFKLAPQFALRAGYEYYGNPFKAGPSSEFTVLTDDSSVLSGGFGYTSGKFFADFAVRQSTEKYSVYNIQPNMAAIGLENINTSALFTLGFRF